MKSILPYEIGSEYWISNENNPIQNVDLTLPDWLNRKMDYKLLLSGRTALDYILYDIEKKKKINRVYLPSYCCESMLLPFIKRNIELLFYDVIVDESGLLKPEFDTNIETDIILLISYFGFVDVIKSDEIQMFRNNGSLILIDETHSIFCTTPNRNQYDYSFASLRKWFEVVSGAIAYKNFGFFDNSLRSCDYICDKFEAMKLKAKYLNGDQSVKKEQFLFEFKKFNDHLNHDYSRYMIDPYSNAVLLRVNVENFKIRRRQNAKILLNRLIDNKIIKPIFKSISEFDCPLFFPVMLDNRLRDALIKELIDNNIFCTVHWPVNIHVPKNEKNTYIYKSELSLICDQRYDENNMHRLVNVIEGFVNNPRI